MSLTQRRTAARACPWLPAALALLALGLAACTPHIELYSRLDGLARQGRYAEGAALIEKSKARYGERNAVLYNLDRGLFLHYAGQYEESNRAFERAERRMDELFTKSIAGEVGAFLSNDNTLPYRGEDFEAVVTNIYRALNYVGLGDIEAALVEARKVNEKLTYINSQYEPDERNVYAEDAFARLLAGVLYEMGGTRSDLNDAFISNRLAADAYRELFLPNYGTRPPAVLKANLLSTATFMGREELRQARERFDELEPVPLDRRRQVAQLYFVHFAGRGPIKVESSINAVMPDGYLLRIAFPAYRKRSYLVHGSKILVDGEVRARLEPAYPLGEIAVQNLDNRKGRIAAKAIARATTKYVATKAAAHQARRKGGEVAGLLTQLSGNVLAAATEQADLRAWETLPDKILVGRVFVQPGKHKLTAQFITAGGATVGAKNLGEVEVQAGRTRFFVLHTGY